VLHPDKCLYTERGYACPKCSYSITQARRSEQDDTIAAPTTLTCSYCIKPIRPDHSAYYYPEGVILCEKHHLDECVTQVSRRIALLRPGAPSLTAKEIIAIVRKIHVDRKQMFADLFKARDQARLATSKRRSRAGPKRK
jgi:hypothetical protein